MLTHLSISNFALIDSLEVDFEKGLSILTGETGSGKSIIIEALEMLLGERADLKALKNPEAKCIIEGEFLISSYGLNDFFRQHEIDYSDTTIFRREINPQGKSRSFVNDTPVNLNVLKELGAFLVNVHSQHETLDIGKSVNQFEFLDAYCGNQSELEDYRKEFKNWHALGLEIEQLTEQEKRSKLDLDYFTFQLEELNTAQLKQGELESSEEELATAEHAEEIRLSVDKATQLMADEQQG
ncbi:MAG TPA: AAA family ATPase, partial [Flavobacteriales bacterium]|nr:AAA family ATPase [Flavobacteriales bacterium]